MQIACIDCEDDVRAGVEWLAGRDPRLAGLYETHGLPPLRRQPGGFEALLYMITEQMISLKAAEAIWQRVKSEFHPFDPTHMATAGETAYRACGLSGPKLNAMRALATAVADDRLDFAELATLDDSAVHKSLTSIKGIGDWTAQIYLLGCLGRPDAWPAGDVALQTAVQLVCGLEQRPKPKQMIEIAEPWRPLRAVAARLLWAHYRVVRLEATRR